MVTIFAHIGVFLTCAPQLRQRFASAAVSGMSSIEFGRKLLKMWGGRLVEAEPVVRDDPVSDSAVQYDKESAGEDQAKHLTVDG